MRKKAKLTPTGAFELGTVKSLGQHFLRDVKVVEKIIDEAEIQSRWLDEKTCIEIGPGPGVLTKPLLEKGWKVTAIEKDSVAVKGLTEILQPKFPDALTVENEDILDWKPNFPIKKLCIGNLPYYITSPILFWYCDNRDKFGPAIFMVQNEVADRLVAKHNSKAYGRLTVRIQLLCNVQKLFVVPPGAFSPPPKVNSAVVLLSPKEFSFGSEEEDKDFSAFTTTLFSARRKMLRRVLKETLEEFEVLLPGSEELFWNAASQLKILPETRPDAIAPAGIFFLHQYFWNLKKKTGK